MRDKQFLQSQLIHEPDFPEKKTFYTELIDGFMSQTIQSTKQVIECRLIHLQEFTEKQTSFYRVD